MEVWREGGNFAGGDRTRLMLSRRLVGECEEGVFFSYPSGDGEIGVPVRDCGRASEREIKKINEL